MGKMLIGKRGNFNPKIRVGVDRGDCLIHLGKEAIQNYVTPEGGGRVIFISNCYEDLGCWCHSSFVVYHKCIFSCNYLKVDLEI